MKMSRKAGEPGEKWGSENENKGRGRGREERGERQSVGGESGI